MDWLGLKKKTESSISDPSIRTEARRYSARTQLAFLPDQVIGKSWFFRLLTLVYYYVYIYFHGFEGENSHYTVEFASVLGFIVEGIEKIDRDQGCLFIARHSSHNGEILGTIVAFYHKTGRVLR